MDAIVKWVDKDGKDKSANLWVDTSINMVYAYHALAATDLDRPTVSTITLTPNGTLVIWVNNGG